MRKLFYLLAGVMILFVTSCYAQVTNVDGTLKASGKIFATGTANTVTAYALFYNIATGEFSYADTSNIGGGGGLALTGGSGIEINGTSIDLNGALSGNTTLEQTGTDVFRFRDKYTTNSRSSEITLANGLVSIWSYENDSYNSGSARSRISFDGGTVSMAYLPFIGSSKAFTLSSSGFLVDDPTSLIGLVGAGYFGGTANDNAYAQQKFVNDAIAASSGLWTLTGNNLSPTTSGTSILIPSSDSLKFGDGTAYIREQGPGNGLTFYADGVNVSRFNGSTARFYDVDVELTRDYGITSGNNAKAWVDVATDQWNYKDGVTDTVTLAQLAAGAPSDTVVIDSFVITREQWHSFPFGLGANNSGDSAVMLVNANMGGWIEYRDSIAPQQLKIECDGVNGDATIRVFHGTDPYAAGTPVCAAAQVTTGGGTTTVTSFSVTYIPKDHWIWCEITAVGSTKPNQILANFAYTFY
jgi:hypothetical protein